MADQHRPVMSPETLTRLAGAMTEFATAWTADVDALRAVENELSTTTTLLNTSNMRRDDLQGDLDAALADNKLLLDRNAYLEARVQLIADRARDAEHGMAAVRQQVETSVRGDGTIRDRGMPPAAPVVKLAIAPASTERLAKLAREIEPSLAAAAPPTGVATRQVREIDAGSTDGTDLPQDPPPIARTPVPDNIFQRA